MRMGAVVVAALVALLAQRERQHRRAHEALALRAAGLELRLARGAAMLQRARHTLGDHDQSLARQVQERTQALEEKTQRLEEADRLKSQFLSNTSHELRTPLSAIMGYVDMLLMGVNGEVSEMQRATLEKMRRNARRLLSLINDLLDLSTIQAQRLRFHPQPVNLALLLEEASFETRTQAERRGLHFRLDIDESLPSLIQSDPERLFQMLDHLLHNALKFTRSGHIIVRAWADATHCLIEVEDSGIGIEPHLHQLIFDEFRQADGSRTREIGGVGLGLAIVRRLCEMMGGAVSVQSTPGQGSTFRLTLPHTLPAALTTPPPQSFEVP